MAKKVKLSVTVDGVLVKRLDKLAKAMGRNRSAVIEQMCRDGLDDAEMTVKAFTDPVIMQAFGQAFGNRDVLKAVASSIQDDMSDKQLDLFVKGMKAMTDKTKSKKPT